MKHKEIMQPTPLGTRDEGLENGTETQAEDTLYFRRSDSLEGQLGGMRHPSLCRVAAIILVSKGHRSEKLNFLRLD